MKSFKKAVLLRRNSDLSNISPIPVENEEDDDGFFDTAEMLLHVDAHDEGGLAFSNKQLLDSQRGAILEIAKEAGKKLLMGSFNLINLSMPVKMSEPRSYLQKLTDVWVYPRLLQKAADAEDPVERLKWVATWFTAGLQHVFQSWKKPFNPILGETWQAVQAGGSQIALEQISHHPAISAFQMIGPGGDYTFCGHSQPDVQFKSNSIKTLAKGYRTLHFRRGDHNIDIVYPTYYMRGILYSAMPRGDMDGTVLFTDPSRLLCCELQFGEIPGSEDPLLRRSDTMEGAIYSLPADWKKGDVVPTVLASTRSSKGFFSRLSDTGSSSGRGSNSDPSVVLASCTGNWLSHLDWDESRYWTLVEEQPQLWQSVADPLPSDSRFRLDLATLLANDLLGAQAAKEALEQRQRHEAKLRKEGAAASNH